jgi:signal transduction histidine kinase
MQSIRVLLVEDDPGQLELSHRPLVEAGTQFSVRVARTLAEAVELLSKESFDVALTDLGLPDSDGLMTLMAIREVSPHLPHVVLTSRADEQLGMQALEQGAQDYLVKGVSAEALRRAVSYAVQRQQSITENRSLLMRLQLSNELLADKNARLQVLFETAQTFVDNVSHEFRTPLTVIREFASILHDGLAGPVNDQQREYTDIITDRVDDLAIMVDDMLDASRIEAGMLGIWRRECHVSAIVSHVVRMLERKSQLKGIALVSDIPAGLPPLFCDFDKAVRVIINLTVNAIKFSPEKSIVRIWARIEPDQDEVTIGVSDCGPGLSPEELARIFARFEQLDKTSVENHKGFGLGLTIARELAELNLGRLEANSQVGKGTTFYCTVPLAEPTQLIGRYLRKADAFGTAPKAITTITVRAQPCSKLDTDSVIDEFLQHTMRCADLVLRAAPNNWLIMAKCRAEEVLALTERIKSAWRQYVRNCPIEGLPQLQFEPGKTYPLGNEIDENIASLSAAFNFLTSSTISASPLILLVDDDPALLVGLSLRLKSAGYEVTSASGGRHGIDAALRLHPDAVILDMRMPDLDGLSTLAILSQHPQTATTPVIMLSASLRDRQQALDMGARYFLNKPCEPERMFAALKAVMPDGVTTCTWQPTQESAYKTDAVGVNPSLN